MGLFQGLTRDYLSAPFLMAHHRLGDVMKMNRHPDITETYPPVRVRIH